MRFGIPKYRLPRDVLDAEMQRIVDMGVTVKLGTKVDDLARHDAGRRLRRRLPRRRRAHRQARVHPGQGFGRASSTPSPCCARWKARSSRCSAAASSSTAAATPRSTSPAPPSASAPPRPSSSTGARASACRRTTSRSRRRSRKACWSSGSRPSSRSATAPLTIEKMELDEKGNPAAHRRFRDARGRLGGAGARPGRRPLAARRASPASRSTTASSASIRRP